MLSSWIIYSIAFSQIVILYIITAKPTYQFIYQIYLNRNKAWADTHPEFVKKNTPSFIIWLSYLAGAAWIVFIGYSISIAFDSPGYQINSIFLPIVPYLVIVYGYIGIQYYRIYKTIPASDVRSASLERRNLSDFLPISIFYIGCTLFGIIILFYVNGIYQELITQEIFIRRITGLSIVVIITAIGLYFSLIRKPSAIDDVWPSYRKIEVIGWVVIIYLGILVGLLRILNDFFQIYPMEDVTFFVLMSIAVQASYIYSLKKINYPIF